MTRLRWWLETTETRVPLHGGSVLVGRSPDCDVVLTNEAVSRHHALFRVVEDGVEVIPVGRRGVGVNGVSRDEPCTLREGDVVEVAEHRFTLRSEALADEVPGLLWFVERTAGVLMRVGAAVVSVGGGPEDDLVVEGWPPRGMALHPVGAGLVLEALVPGIDVGKPLDVGDLTPLRSGDRVALHGASLRVVALPADPSKPTGVPALEEPASGVALTVLPRGGQLVVTTGTRVRSVWLAERRCELVALLMQPPPPLRVGEMIPDATVAERLWPGADSGRIEINTLVCRVRKDLERVGVDGVTLIERRGGALRLNLAPGASVTVTKH